jgi:two-component system phosphate regulon sensor histidine kinase PhoR
VEKVLQLARIEKEEFKVQCEAVDLHAVIHQVIRNFDLPGKDSQGIIKTNLEASQYWIQADPLHLTNILFNLLDNAVKYSDTPPVIHFSTRNQGNCIRLSVSDEGAGISPVHQKRVFDKFFRVPSGDVHNVKGFGLGLYYVRNIVAAHQWKISLLSEPGKGSSFTLTIPLKDPSANGKA